jgi:AcrR family transcriptional regulator
MRGGVGRAFGQEPGPNTREDIIEMATRLFAALGYDATPIEMIAHACGLDVTTVTALAGDKLSLYREVMRRAHEGQRALLDTLIAEFAPNRAGIHQLFEQYLDYCIAHPELSGLWAHRWQSDAADAGNLEQTTVRPDLDRILSVLGELVPPDLDLDMAVMNLVGFIRAFCIGATMNREGGREGPESPVMLQRFRKYMHHHIDRILELD